MFETRECLIGKTHDKQPNPSKDLRVAVCIDVEDRNGGETTLQSDRKEKQRTPYGTSRQRRGNASLEKAAAVYRPPLTK